MNRNFTTILLLALAVMEPPSTVNATKLATSNNQEEGTLDEFQSENEVESQRSYGIPPKWNKLPFKAGNHLAEAFFRVSKWTA